MRDEALFAVYMKRPEYNEYNVPVVRYRGVDDTERRAPTKWGWLGCQNRLITSDRMAWWADGRGRSLFRISPLP